MAKYELPIYGENDEIIKTYETNHVSWAVYIKAADMETSIKNKTAREQFDAVGDILKDVFAGLTDDHLMRADGMDVMNTFAQIVNGGQQIKGGNSKGKNA
ncbi:phage tail assembly chaperone G [Solibacillus silvestris]